MADSKASALTLASGLASADLWAGVQGGADRKFTAQLVLDFINANIGTAAFRALVDDIDTATMRGTLGLGTAAQAALGSNGNTLGVLNGNNTYSGSSAFTGAASFSLGVTLGAIVSSGLGVSTGDVSIEVGGARTGDGNVYIDLHATSGADYEARMLRGTGANGNLTLNNLGTGSVVLQRNSTAQMSLTPTGNLSGVILTPATDNSLTLGSASLRWSTVYAGTGTINTSDAREKQWRGGLTDAELRAGRRIIDDLGFYQWLHSIAEKGDDGARYHFGVRAQIVFGILEDEGLDWRRYAWCCHNVWDAADAIVIPETEEVEVEEPYVVYERIGTRRKKPVFGQVEKTRTRHVPRETGRTIEITPARSAGELYGIRPDQLALFLIAVQARENAALSDRLDRVEAQLADRAPPSS